jgi:hypothetical protein
MAARAYGGLFIVREAGKSLTELLRQKYPTLQSTVFCTLTLRAHFDNSDRLFLQVDGTDADYMVPGEPIDFFLAHGPVYSDQLSARAVVAGDRMYIVAFES